VTEVRFPQGRPGRWWVAGAVSFATLGGCVAVIAGSARALSRILSNEYLDLRFWNTIAAIAVQEVAVPGIVALLAGAVAFLALGLLLPQARDGSSARSGLLRLMRHPGLVTLVLWMVPLITTTVIATLAVFAHVGRRYAMAVAVASVLLGLLLLAIHWWVRNSGDDLSERACGRILGLWTSVSVLVAGGLILQYPFPSLPITFEPLLDHALLVAAAVVIYLVVSSTARALLRPVPAPPPLPLIVLVLLYVILLPTTYFFEGRTLHAARPHNVLIIAIDTLRADRTSLLGPGEPRDLTPTLRRIAERGTVFRVAISQAPWTLPAFASILTGLYPREHGATGHLGFLRPRETTLFEIVREAGYTTGSVVSQYYLARGRGLVQGSVEHDERNDVGEYIITSRLVTDYALDFMQRHSGGEKPFFLFVHYFDPHYVYRDHTDFDYADGYSGWLQRRPLHSDDIFSNRHLLAAEDLDYLRDLYDEEVAFTDHQVGRLIDFLEQSQRLDDTAVIVVSDHGEEFMEHGWIGHTNGLHEELIHVPLVVTLPGIPEAPSVVEHVVETRSIFPTVLDYLGIEFPSRAPSLLALLRADGSGDDSPHRAFSSVWLSEPIDNTGERARMTALRTDRWKLIVDHLRERELLFDLESDPAELHNVATEQVEMLARMRQVHDEWFEQTSRTRAGPADRRLSPAEIERLRALGYL
jgi:arylsulfatase A-like enzyme